MSKILLFEPYRVLQQALALSLFPEHEVRVKDSIDAAALGALTDVDLLIIDGPALRDAGLLTADVLSGIENAAMPTLWIGESESAPKTDRLAVIAKPIESAALQSAVAGLLSSGSADRKKNSAEEPIDLVEVVDEAPAKAK